MQIEQCGVCKKKVEDEEQGLECDLYDQWEHMEFVRSVDRPSESRYAALTENRSKAILYVCEVLCLSVLVNLKWNMNTHAKNTWLARVRQST